MIATIVISGITFLLIALSLFLFPKIKIGKIQFHTYWVIALIGATILLCSSLAPIENVWQQLTSNSKINPLKILVLFFSMTLISIMLDEFGLFKYLANLAVKVAKNNQYSLFFILYGLVSILTIFTSNDIVILTLTPFICFFCKRATINPLPYLIAEFTAANTWSLMFVIGNPTNIFLATTADINFVQYLKVMALPTIAAGIVELGLLFLLFRKHLKQSLLVSVEEHYEFENKVTLIVGVIHLVVCLIFLIISSYLNLEMWMISLVCAGSLLVYTVISSIFVKNDRKYVAGSLKRLPYPLIPFFLSMFVIVVALSYQGVAGEIAKSFGNQNTIWVYGYTSFIASNLVNNIPMSILYSNLCSSLSGLSYKSSVYASIVGSNIGAFLTPMGALAGIMFTGLLEKHEVKFSFIDFIKYGVAVAIPTLTVCLSVLLLTINF